MLRILLFQVVEEMPPRFAVFRVKFFGNLLLCRLALAAQHFYRAFARFRQQKFPREQKIKSLEFLLLRQIQQPERFAFAGK